MQILNLQICPNEVTSYRSKGEERLSQFIKNPTRGQIEILSCKTSFLLKFFLFIERKKRTEKICLRTLTPVDHRWSISVKNNLWSHPKNHKKELIPEPSQKRNWKGSSQASSLRNRGIAVNLLFHSPFESFQKPSHIFGIDIHK
jgi:hypothetical protein